MPKGITQSTGSAKIDRSGHTTNRKHGSDPQAKAVSRPAPTDLKP